MNTFIGYINYGCLTAEKKNVWTAGTNHVSAVCSDRVEITVPEDCGWELYETVMDNIGVTTPWGQDYPIHEVLAGNDTPCFRAYDNNNKLHRVNLKYKKI